MRVVTGPVIKSATQIVVEDVNGKETVGQPLGLESNQDHHYYARFVAPEVSLRAVYATDVTGNVVARRTAKPDEEAGIQAVRPR